MANSSYMFIKDSGKKALAWVNFSAQGALNVRESFNVNSGTDQGVGKYRINFKTPMEHSDYCVVGTASIHYGSDNISIVSHITSLSLRSLHKNYVEIMAASTQNNEFDPTTVTLVIFGD